MSRNAARSAVVQDLTRRLRDVEHGLRRSAHPVAAQQSSIVPTGLAPLDQLLPDGGFRLGTLVEWLSDESGSGALTLALLTASQILKSSGSLMVIDSQRTFHPPAAAGLGIDLDRTIVVRPNESPRRQHQRVRPAQSNDALWALEQSLRSPAVALTICRLDYLNGHVFRRLQLAAEVGGGLCFLMRPLTAARQPTWADVRLQVKSITESASRSDGEPARRMRIELLRCRSGLTGNATEVELCHETSDVRPVTKLAGATHSQRAAGA